MRELKNKVENILENYPSTRNSDDELYSMVIKFINPNAATMPFVTVLNNRKSLGLPNMESVSRARRKICESRPDLRGTETVEQGRAELEKEFREWAVNDGR